MRLHLESLFILESEMLFISGPVVVSPLKRITFQAYLPGREKMNAKWWKIKDHTKEELKVDNQKYHINYQSNDIVCFEIFWADQEDSAAYQLSLGKRRSNRINVCVDGKYVNLLDSFVVHVRRICSVVCNNPFFVLLEGGWGNLDLSFNVLSFKFKNLILIVHVTRSLIG